MPRSLLLDTCAVIWLVSGGKELSRSARRQIDEAPRVYVSAISAWEISLKAARGDMELPVEPEDWFHRVLEQHDLALAELSTDVLTAANRLPWHHRDPADRFILATARLRRLTIVTTDRRFPPYGLPVIH